MNWRCAASRLLLALLLCPAASAAKEPPGRKKAVRFGTADGWTIAGLYRPPRSGRPVALLAHGVASSKGEWDSFEPRLWRLGIGTLAIDLRGHGESTLGPAGRTDFSAFDASGEWPLARKDLEAALSFLKERGIAAGRVGLIGASIGANLVSRVAAERPETPWVVLLSPGADYRGVGLEVLAGRKVFVGACPSDGYAFATSRKLASLPEGPFFLPARTGHGVQMFDDPEFLKGLLEWIAAAAGRRGKP